MKITSYIFIMVMLFCGACNKFVETRLPVNQIPATTVFSSDKSLESALSGAYGDIANVYESSTLNSMLFSDELSYLNASGQILDAQENTYTPVEDFTYFTNYYNCIYNDNAIIEALADPAPGLTPSVVKRVKGESLFLRAFAYFQLVNFYGGVPLVRTTDVQVSAYLGNAPVDSIYSNIISDLTESAGLLTDDYPTTDRIRANRQVANAFLAKAQLYRQHWAEAETAASTVIGSSLYGMNNDLSLVFANGSRETLWELWNENGYTSLAQTLIPYTNPTTVYYRIRPGLLSAFESGDGRKSVWTKAGEGSASSDFYPYKYRSTPSGGSTEYLIFMRLAEQYLIRAEARAQQDHIPEGLEDLNEVRHRAGLPDATAASKEELLGKIMQERRIELAFEDCSRWFDLNRTGQTAAVLKPIKSGFMDRAVLLPFPDAILSFNKNLQQNKGY
jgi:hypothetical protein